MDYQAFTNDSLSLMHCGAKGALAVDDELGKLGQEKRFRIRETSEWMKHAADLEAEMLRRGMAFEGIDWSEPQAAATEGELGQADHASPPSQPTPSDETTALSTNARLRKKIAAVLKIGAAT